MLFSHDYQAGPAFEVFSPQGSNPLANWQLSHPKSVKKVYDKSVKGYVYSCPGRSGCKMQLPKDEHKSMALLQPFLVLQLYLTPGQPLSIELSVVDQEGTHRRLYLSTAFTEIKITPLHCQIPLTLVQRGAWVNLAVHVADLVAAAFKGVAFQAVNLLILSAVFKVRRIFTLKDQPPDPSASGLGAARSVPLPMQFDFPAGIATTTQVLDFARVHAFAAAASQAARSAAHRSGIRTPLGKMRPSVQIPRSTWEGAELVAEAGLPASPSSLLPAGKLHDGGTHVAFGTRVTAQAASPGHKRSRPSSGSHTSAMGTLCDWTSHGWRAAHAGQLDSGSRRSC
ncbi:hypothetical protein WJX72_003835 [[Myrmecia] bisecta]|uniref:CFA20 domain-containing protein n=1 Tax=[Myrmecia] bisecta TaxID=41462 RepID=A0AAW1PEB0_9CHLO